MSYCLSNTLVAVDSAAVQDFNLDDANSVSNDDMSEEEKTKLIDLLSKEGQPGWFKKMTKTVTIFMHAT